MNTNSSRSTAMTLALLLSCVSCLVFVSIHLLFDVELNILFLFVFGSSIFFFSFLLFVFLLKNLFYKGIREILHSIRYHRGKMDNNENRGGLLDSINLEIVGWAEDRKNEIEQLRKLEIYRKEFLGNVSHELKTPIFNIQGYVLTLLDGGLEDPTINREYLFRAEKSVDRMISIVEDLGAISQLETGELELEQERFEIVSMVKDVLESQEMNATGKGIILSLENINEKPIYVIGDKFRIRQVLINLIVNSIKYGKEYGETRVNFYRGENIVIEVTDNGIGIGKEHLSRLFERFYRVDKSRSREQGGTGLGLSIVKHIIEAHNQTINVTSTEGVGSVFTFSLKKG